ncbi:hypothetical protein B9P99_01705 [Candidatus Marsarchaeota G1 archaeon OSP_B]|jgi:saccharopine dehydrogenase (NAD+, L-lysine-forming)|uniref:Saccharopine dehydrogenase NADP binding domain-containing protein n=5 Tax=Candidatus Marsarchaeota TaxID=1978152 RepID=A0A2R6C050_9ARCH|nr:MAG: hypothetical protein B9Q01_04480 [Candidatus Marsarchaeota G1 archaeon OSP_D]PSN86176.1 MAG: hypothetical protein B9Q02_03385 [Candidatus Marsarchaeota G1 archaeon BE_D]PSN88283.1 MAG: hypothetical protein B9Q00_06040 [Candidatus Marsarchaeota G1 archaeon OSP_C]PSN94435.1 MAG: hypothetical protein B9P99_01705 [Candidatus Marsarchaeota G1 archaeon OSP_B]PSO04243.1 MAG: hypothetical protein B9Q12_02725 [Candidatus Marsarchaeota G2 archaeon ECH_B_SAG-G06]
MKVAVIGGAGMVSKATVFDLMNAGVDTLVVDLRKPSFDVNYIKGDLNNIDEVASAIRNCDYAINAAQYYLNLNAMQACLKAGVNYIDLGGLFWMTNQQLKLNEQFEKAGLLALIGMGAEPGITNVAAAYLHKKFGTPEKIKIRNGWRSLGKNKINWSLDTQLDEMTMEAPVFEDGKFVYKPPFSLSEECEFSAPVGKIKTYLTIHSEIATFPTSFSGVKYVDWMEGGDGIETMYSLAQLGFGDKEEVLGVSPRRYLYELLKKKGLLGYSTTEKPDEWEAAKVVFHFSNKQAEIEVVIPPNPELGVDATQYGAGVPPSVAVQLGVKGKGVLPPEKVVPPERFFDELSKRGFKIILRAFSYWEDVTKKSLF